MSRKYAERIISIVENIDNTKDPAAVTLRRDVLRADLDEAYRKYIVPNTTKESFLKPFYMQNGKTLEDLLFKLRPDSQLSADDLRTIQYQILNLNQAIQACLATFHLKGDESTDTLFSPLSQAHQRMMVHFFNVLEEFDEKQEPRPLSDEEKALFAETPFHLLHKDFDVSFYYEKSLMIFQILLAEFKTLEAEEKKKLDRSAETLPSSDPNLARRQHDYYQYCAESLTNVISIINSLRGAKSDAPQIFQALESLYCNIIINGDIRLANAQADLHQLIFKLLAPEEQQILERKKPYYIELAQFVRQNALYRQYKQLKVRMERMSTWKGTWEQRGDLLGILDQILMAKESDKNYEYLYSDRVILKVLDKLTDIYNESNDKEHKDFYRPFIIKLITFVTHPLIKRLPKTNQKLLQLLNKEALKKTSEIFEHLSRAISGEMALELYSQTLGLHDVATSHLVTEARRQEIQEAVEQYKSRQKFSATVSRTLGTMCDGLKLEIQALPEVPIANYKKYTVLQKTFGQLDSSELPWKLLSQLLCDLEKNLCHIFYLKMRFSNNLVLLQTSTLVPRNELQTSFANLDKMVHIFSKLLENFSGRVSAEDFSQRFQAVVSLLTTEDYRRYVAELVIYAHAKIGRIGEHTVQSHFMNLYRAKLIYDFFSKLDETKFWRRILTIFSSFARESRNLQSAGKSLDEIYRQLDSLFCAYGEIYDLERQQIASSSSSDPNTKSSFILKNPTAAVVTAPSPSDAPPAPPPGTVRSQPSSPTLNPQPQQGQVSAPIVPPPSSPASVSSPMLPSASPLQRAPSSVTPSVPTPRSSLSTPLSPPASPTTPLSPAGAPTSTGMPPAPPPPPSQPKGTDGAPPSSPQPGMAALLTSVSSFNKGNLKKARTDDRSTPKREKEDKDKAGLGQHLLGEKK